MKSISLTSRHDFDSLLGVLHLGEADLIDLEVLIYFCGALPSVESISLTLRHEFIFYSALTSVGSISLTLRHQFNFCSGSLSDIYWSATVVSPDQEFRIPVTFENQISFASTLSLSLS